MSLRDQIIQIKDLQTAVVEVKEWEGVKIECRSITARERVRIYELADGGDGKVNMAAMYPLLVIQGCFDPDTGDRVFTDDDLEMLSGRNAKAVGVLAEKVALLSGITEETEKDLGNGSSSEGKSGSSTN